MCSSNSLVNSRLVRHNLISRLIILQAPPQTTTAIKGSLSVINRVFDRSSLLSFPIAKHT
jgi:hypothetical protein